ncbi:MAG: hypothetical protein ACC652_06865 [Acidimicrobiales bacterium]
MGELWNRVQQYADFGWHHTGSPVDEVTRAWFGGLLVSCGADVSEISYSFDQYEVERCEVLVDDRIIDSLPLFYEGVASLDGGKIHTDEADVLAGGVRGNESFENAIDRALAAHADVAVIATHGADGHLVVTDRPACLGSGLPVVLVPGREAETMEQSTVSVLLHSGRGTGNSAVVVGTFNEGAGPPILIAVPLTGWFGCASERGGGVAIAIELATRLAQLGPVTVIATTGTEIGDIGAQTYAQAMLHPPKAVIHLGASLAAGVRRGDRLELSNTRYLLTNLPEDRLTGMHVDAHRMGTTLISDPPDWTGEGRQWRQFGRPLLSFLGTSPLFHTPQDLPGESTSATLLDEAMDGVWAIFGKLLSGFA